MLSAPQWNKEISAVGARGRIWVSYPLLVGVLTSAVALAQTESARISGRVSDPTDAVIVGAECKITNLETNISIVTSTNQDGIYVIADLRPATYRLRCARV